MYVLCNRNNGKKKKKKKGKKFNFFNILEFAGEFDRRRNLGTIVSR